MTIAIPSYQRRDSLVRLLRTLCQQACAAPSEWGGIDIVTVVDGSTDGSYEAANEVAGPLPITVVSQDNAGRSAARNTCLEHATGDLTYFLDDDLVPAGGTILGHRRAPRDGATTFVLGPCLIPPEVAASQITRSWFAERYAQLARAGIVDRFDHFSIANASGPTEQFRSVGGFDTEFVGYGFEDHEIGLRLMQKGAFERYDASLVAWHHTTVDQDETVVRGRERGRNAVRLLHMHPDAASLLLPDRYLGRIPWLLDRLPARSPRMLAALAAAAQCSARRAAGWPGRVDQRLWFFADAAAHAAGVADMDPALVSSFLGGTRAPRFARADPSPRPGE